MAQNPEFKVKLDLEVKDEGAAAPGTNNPGKVEPGSFDDYARNLDKANNSLSSASNDLNRAMAKGYNPNGMANNPNGMADNPNNGMTGKPSGLPEKKDSNLDKGKKEERPYDGASSAPNNEAGSNETAPDVNKDYGSSAPPYQNRNKKVRPEGEESDTDKKNNNNTSNNHSSSETPTGEEESPNGVPPTSGLQKKDDLEDGKKQEEEQNPGNGNKDNKSSESEDGGDKKEVESPDSGNQSDKNGDSGEKNPEAPNDLDKSKNDNQNQAQNQGQPQTGNGYGALRNRPTSTGGDKNDRVRQNMEHSRRVQNGNDEGNKKTPTSSGTINEESSPSFGSRIKRGFKNLLSGKADSEDDVGDNNGRTSKKKKNAFDQAKDTAKSAIINFLKANPHIAVILAVIILFFLILIITNLSNEFKSGGGNGSSSGSKCSYSLNGVLSTGTVNLEGIQVEIVNCDATASNYTVLETVDFEKYVVGVALAEIGYSPSSPEYFKTGVIAARNFALTRNNSMCPSNPDNCFYGYNPSTGKIRMRACEADQVYWDYDKDIYRYDRGAISLYSPEINSGTVWKSALDEATKEEVLNVASDVKGKVLLDDSGNVVPTGYINTDQQEWIRLANEGHTYDEILSIHYGGGSISGAACSSGNIDYGDYVLSSDGDTILHEPLETFLPKQGTSLEAFNGLIQENVQKAGYGTRAGVVAAAVTLIAELGNNYNVKVPYYWGGGHADGVVDGALGYWGSTQCHTYANNTSYNYCGLDCSGFVPWAIKNGGFNMAQMLAGGFQNLPGVERVSLSNHAVLEPGDLLESSGHIVLVVGIEETTGNYICAEASGNSAGVLFTRRPFNSSGYWGVKMDGWYSTHQRSSG